MTSGVFELALLIRPEICRGAIDEGIVSSIKEGVSKDKQCHKFLWQLSKARGGEKANMRKSEFKE